MRVIHREDQEQRERELLSRDAARSFESEGRDRSTAPDILRNDFQRDRDKILHSKSFRRLSHKTQVFLAAEGDHYRTRLTHTLEVAQIARTITRALGLNEDLAEAIALGHDLGHTPFGHSGEQALSRCLERHGRRFGEGCGDGDEEGGRLLYRHNVQSLRVVERIENGGAGLNLTPEVRDGILHHTGSVRAETLEGRVVATADRIAYVNHDIDDAMRGGIIYPLDIPLDISQVLGFDHGGRIDTLTLDVIQASRGQDEIRQSPACGEAMAKLREFMFEAVYYNPLAKGEESKAQDMIARLFEHYQTHPDELPPDYQDIRLREGTDRAVCDYIAGMTDHYAVAKYNEAFVPLAWAVK